jgi:hypothetical protein
MGTERRREGRKVEEGWGRRECKKASGDKDAVAPPLADAGNLLDGNLQYYNNVSSDFAS